MAARREPDTRSVGRAQSGRPHLTVGSQSMEAGERVLTGALSVPIEQIVPDPGQPRRELEPAGLAELVASITEYGVLQPLVVRERGFLDDGRTQYMIVAGGRRYAAALQAGLTRLPVLVRESEGATVRILQLTENLQREALPPVDEARALKELMDLAALDTRALASRLHRSHTYVADRLKLIVHEDVAQAVSHGALTPSAATEVAREPDTERRQALLHRASTGGLQKREVQELRRRARAEDRQAGGEPTLRQVAREMGANEVQIAGAAQARREEPTLSAAEALMLAMQTPSPDTAAADVAPPHDIEEPALAALVHRAGGTQAALALLQWGADRVLPLASLMARIRALEEN